MSVRTPLILATLSLALGACGEESEAPLVAEEILRLETDQVVLGLEHYMTTDGVRRAHLLADTAFFLQDENSVDLRSVQLTFYETSGSVTSILTAETGTYDWETGDMVARGNVVVLDPEEGRRIETSVMHYARERDRIWSDQATTMHEPDGTVVEGTAFESDASLDQVDLTSGRLRRPPAEGSSGER